MGEHQRGAVLEGVYCSSEERPVILLRIAFLALLLPEAAVS